MFWHNQQDIFILPLKHLNIHDIQCFLFFTSFFHPCPDSSLREGCLRTDAYAWGGLRPPGGGIHKGGYWAGVKKVSENKKEKKIKYDQTT